METSEKKPFDLRIIIGIALFALGAFLAQRLTMLYVKRKLTSPAAFDFIASFFPPFTTPQDEKDSQA